MLCSAVVYSGLMAALLGAVSIVKPLSVFRIRRRRTGAFILVLGLISVFIAWNFPTREVRVSAPRTALDRFGPVYQFREFHSIRVAASRARVYRAIRSVTADEIPLFRTLTGIRRLGLPVGESILSPPPHQPILDVATRTSFLLLADEPNREIVIGTAVATLRNWRPTKRPTPEGFRLFHEPGFVLAAMNFRLEEDGASTCLLTTETRVHATSAAVCRRFAPYWRTISRGVR